ncbi:DUF2306 domain-containing protein [Pseudacidovorax sp. RU35E]|uniref:DUF2306 domain-containing protein n=1 Tax=Pseudacidovorax sp. RU35E TaxID=1907403 RepID=UPI00095737B6|nr:DUF2306 domain-containing protein [Pseudacidovorax sp. RU35E]SIR44829.1 Uncharacterized membrane protein [Pseudacidovorax sp. RU35E]
MKMTPVIAVHLACAVGALFLGPVAIRARWRRRPQPRMHRAFGYAWITLMLMTGLSALFIRDYALPNVAGYTLIHLLVPVSWIAMFLAFRFLLRGQIAAHRGTMIGTYVGACLVTGAFTLLPGRYLGDLIWTH